MVVSLTTTPMMCAHLLKEHEAARLAVSDQRARLQLDCRPVRPDAATRARASARSRWWCWLATIGLNVYLFVRVPKGFFPQQDTGRMNGTILGDQDTSFQAMQGILLQMVKIVQADPAVDTVTGFTGGSGGGGSTINQARMFIR